VTATVTLSQSNNVPTISWRWKSGGFLCTLSRGKKKKRSLNSATSAEVGTERKKERESAWR